MTKQKGRHKKQQQQKDKKQARLEAQGRGKSAASNGHTEKSNNLGIKSTYLIKKQLQSQGIYSEKSPFTPTTNTNTPPAKNGASRWPLLTKFFEKGSKIDVVKKLGNCEDYSLPKIPEEFKDTPCLLMAELHNGEWSLTRQFKTATDGKWVAQELPLSDLKNEDQIINLLSKWQYIAWKISDGNGSIPNNFKSRFTVVGPNCTLSDYNFK
ncbi:MAG: hypothetical protein KDJ35_07805 [Alphaproteobacteria bacterium]|nr:hypothetical protein [Alphaproteobacteria bacterium]